MDEDRSGQTSDLPPAEHESGVPGTHIRSWTLTILALLATFYTLYLAREFLLPVVLAMLLALLLSPLVLTLRRLRLPAAAAAALVVAGLIGAIAGIAYGLSGPAAEWMEQAPRIMREIEHKAGELQRTVRDVSEAAQKVEQMTEESDETPVVRIREQSLRDIVVDYFQTLIVSGLMMVFLLYFLLAAGERFLRNLMSALPTFGDKRRTLEIMQHLQREISGYLMTFTLINITLASVTSVVLYFIGLPNPWLWGVMAGLLNFIPYMGPAVVVGVLTVVSALTFDELRTILLAPGVFLVITSLEGQVVTPTILGHRLALNPILIFLGLIFWGWLWGVIGALLAVPIMVSIKIVCDHIEPLKPIGIVMER